MMEEKRPILVLIHMEISSVIQAGHVQKAKPSSDNLSNLKSKKKSSYLGLSQETCF